MAMHMITSKIINLNYQKIQVESKEQIKKIDNMKKVVAKIINWKIKVAQPIVLKVAVQRIFIKGK